MQQIRLFSKVVFIYLFVRRVCRGWAWSWSVCVYVREGKRGSDLRFVWMHPNRTCIPRNNTNVSPFTSLLHLTASLTKPRSRWTCLYTFINLDVPVVKVSKYSRATIAGRWSVERGGTGRVPPWEWMPQIRCTNSPVEKSPKCRARPSGKRTKPGEQTLSACTNTFKYTVDWTTGQTWSFAHTEVRIDNSATHAQ